MIAFNQTGLFKNDKQAEQRAAFKTENKPAPIPENTQAKPASYDVKFFMTDVKVNDYDYKILESTFEPINPDTWETESKTAPAE